MIRPTRVWLRPLVCLALLALMTVTPLSGSLAAAEPDAPLTVHMIGLGEYMPVESLTLLKSYLEERYKIVCTTSFGKRSSEPLPDLDALKSADVMLIFARRMNLPDEQMAIIRSHWEQGKPIVAIRTASHAFQPEDNAVFDRQVLGGNYRGGGGPIRVVAEPTQTKHPVLSGVEPYQSPGAFGQGELAKDAVVLQVGEREGSKSRAPVSWVHTYRGGRTFYTGGGVPEDFQQESFRRLLANALLWTSQRDPDKMQK